MSRGWRCGLALALLCACRGAPQRTQTVIFVDAEPRLRAATHRLHVSIQSEPEGNAVLDQTVEPRWPIKLVIVPLAGDARRKYRVTASCLDGAEQRLASASLVTGFKAGQARFAELLIKQDCGTSGQTAEIEPEQLGRSEEDAYLVRASCQDTNAGPDSGTPSDEDAGLVGAPDAHDAGEAGAAAMASAGGPTAGSSGASVGTAGATGSAGAAPNDACAVGFTRAADSCVDIDECADPVQCATHGRCENQAGSFRCVCDGGYKTDGSNCVDVDECAVNHGGCPEQCVNTQGDFSCTCTLAALRPGQPTCPRWHDAVRLDASMPAVSSAPTFGFDATGAALAVWYRSEPSQNTQALWAARFSPSAGWAGAEKIDDIDVGSPIAIAVTASGTAMASWSGIALGVFVKRYTTAAGWSPVLRIGTGMGQEGPAQLVLDAQENALAIWSTWSADATRVWAQRYVVSSGWATPTPLQMGDAGPGNSEVVVARGNDTWFALWHQSDGNSLQINFNMFASNTGWSTPAPLETVAGDSAFPRIAQSADGSAIAVWQKDLGQQRNEVWTNRFAPISGWGTAEKLDAVAAADSAWPTIAMDAQGRGFATWQRVEMVGTQPVTRIWANRYVPGSGWSAAECVSRMTVEANDALYPSVAMDAYGNAIVGWTELSAMHTTAWTNRYVTGVGWTQPMKLKDTPSDTRVSQLAIDTEGRALVLWTETDPTMESNRDSNWAARFE